MINYNTISKANSIVSDCSTLGDEELKSFVKRNGLTCDKFSGEKFSQNKTNNSIKNIALIGGGMSTEREVSYMSCNGIVRSLLELGHRVTFIDMGEDIATVLEKIKPAVVFNGLHGTYGEDGCLSALLNIMKIPYTSSGVLASSIAFNKNKSLDVFKSHGFKVAKSIIVSKNDGIMTDPMPRPYVIKPISQGSSVGVEIIFIEDDFDFKQYDFPYGDEVIVEEYIEGREIQVAVLRGKALGTLEIKLLQGKRFYDYETKYSEGFAEHLCPAPLDDEITQEVLRLSEKMVNIFGAIGMVRIEFLMKQKELYILEVNTHPGMTSLSICPEIAFKEHGITYTQMIEKILADAKYEK